MNFHPSVVAEITEAAKTELDRLADLYKQAGEQFNQSVGKIGEKKNFKIAMEIFKQMETTKNAYRALGISGSVGVHYL
jgi:flagellar biosynthesis chaperone FliJ